MRRVYLPLSDSAADQRALKEKIRSLERSVQLLRSDNIRLVGRCERLSDECDNLVKKEAELQGKCDSFEAKLNDAEGEILNMGDALDLTTQEADKWKAAWSALSRRHKEIRQKLEDSNSETKRKLEFTTNELRELRYLPIHSALHIHHNVPIRRLQEERNQEERNQEQPQPIVPARALKRKVNQAALDSSPSSSTSPTKRVVQPFLKRPRLQCGPPPSHVSQSTQRPDPTLLFRTPSPAKRPVKRRIESDSSTEFDGSSNEESEEEDRPRRLFADYLARKRITGYLD